MESTYGSEFWSSKELGEVVKLQGAPVGGRWAGLRSCGESWAVAGGSAAELGSWQRGVAGVPERSDAFLPELRNQHSQFSHPILIRSLPLQVHALP